jgi:IclR family pca regulon transcriptional regulator
MSKEDAEFVTALARGLTVLKVFNASRPEMTLAEIAAAAQLAPATARRSLHTLQALGYIRSNGKRFVLTPKVLDLSASFLSSMNLQQVAQQHLQNASDLTGDSASVAVLDGWEVVYIASVPAKRAVRVTAGIGTRYPAYATSMGRILLAFASEEQQREALAASRLVKLTNKTEINPEALRRIFARAKENGYASVEDELDYGVVSVAVPLLAPSGSAVAAVNCSTSPSRVMQAELIETRLPILRETSAKISEELRRYPALIHAILG